MKNNFFIFCFICIFFFNSAYAELFKFETSELKLLDNGYIIDAKNGKVVIKLGDKINYLNAKKHSNEGLKDILVSKESLYGKFLHSDVKINDEENGVLKIGTELNETIINQILEAKIHSLEISVTNSINKGGYLLTTIFNDKNNTKDEAITEIYKMLRPGEPPTIEIATQIFNNLFFSSDRRY